MSVRVWAILASGVLLLVGFVSSGKQAHRQTQVRVTMTAERCAASPIELQPGAMVFVVVNRTLRPRTFTIAGRRTRYLPAHHSGSLSLELDRTGVYRFFCVSKGPRARVRTGVIAVRQPPLPPPPPTPTTGTN
ncbi:MAG: cupredoxin domain-containing protein [Actinomycetota bacterium]